MSWLTRCALAVACAAFGCDEGEEAFGSAAHEPAHPALVDDANSEGTSGGSGDHEALDGGSAEACSPHSWILAPDIVNARDVGGTPLVQGGRVACGSIFRGPPLTLTSLGCERARALGFRTVIDLRTESERSVTPDASCTGAEVVTAPLPIPYGLSATDYLADLGAAPMATVFHTFGNPDRYPIYFHCTWGRDRTGVVAAVLLLTMGVSKPEVMAEYMLSSSSVGAYPDALQAVLSEVEARGGPEPFLSSIGISPEEIAVIRSHAAD